MVRESLIRPVWCLLTSQPLLGQLLELLQTHHLRGREFVQLESAGIAARHPGLSSPRPLHELHGRARTSRNFPLPAPATFVLNKAHQEETLSPLIQCRGTLPERWLEAMSSYKKSGKSLKRTHRERGQVSAVHGRLRAAWIAKLYLMHTYLLALSEKTLRIAGEAQGLCTAGKVSLFYRARNFFSSLNLQGLQQEEEIHQVFTRKGRGGNFGMSLQKNLQLFMSSGKKQEPG